LQPACIYPTLFNSSLTQLYYFRTCMKKIGLLLQFLMIFSLLGKAQSGCFEVEAILVDACSSPEGENEMVRFRIGSAPLNTANLTVTWPNNPYQGICQNATTASHVATINASILGCGWVLEPIGGVLPANARVIIVTSTNMQPLANSFAALNDTIYMIFQCAGNTNGHFANNGTGIRTMTMTFSSPAGCTDQVSYDRALLVNINGTTGGSAAVQNGSTVNFTDLNVASYTNTGCNAPFTPMMVTALSGVDTIVCEGAPVGVYATGNGPNNYFWQSTQGTFSPSGSSSSTFTPIVNAVYPIQIIVAGYNACDTVYDSINIAKFASPIDAGAPTNVCRGKSVQLTATGGSNYTWSPNDGTLSTLVGPTTLATPVTSRYYYVTGNFGPQVCTGRDSVFVTIVDNDTISVTGPTDICPGASTTLTATGSASPYIWDVHPNLSCTNCTSPTVTQLTATTYTVRSTSFCPDTVSYTLNATDADTVLLSGDTSICAGTSAQLLATGSIGFHWFPNDGTLNNINIPNPIATPGGTTSYIAYSDGICPDTAFLTVTVVQQPNVSVTPPSATICSGQSVGLVASGAAQFGWFPITDLTCFTCANPTANPTTTTNYTVIGINGNLCYDTVTVPITVNTQENISAITADTAICSGNSVQLSVTHNAASVTWSPNNGTLSNVNINNPVANPSSTTTYMVVTPGICADTAYVTITVNPTPFVTTVPANVAFVCSGDSVQLTASGATSYSWTPNTNISCTTCNNPFVSPTADVFYTVVGTTGPCSASAGVDVFVRPTPAPVINSPFNTICQGDTVPLTVTGITGGATYNWSPTSTLSCSNCQNPDAFPSSQTTYNLTVTQLTCTGTASITLNSIPQPVAGITGNFTICSGQSTTLTATGSGNYLWNNGSTAGTTTVSPSADSLYVLIISAGSCADTASQLVTVNPTPTVTVNPTGASICNGQNVPLTAAGATSYSWSPSGTLSSNNQANTTATPTATTTYDVIGTTGSCADTASVTITVTNYDNLTVSADPTICAGQSTNLSATGAATVVWSPNDGSLDNVNSSTPVATPTITTQYTVMSTSACPDTAQVNVTVNAQDNITASGATTICSGQTANLLVTGSANVTWAPPGSLDNANSVNPVASPTTTTTYTVTSNSTCPDQDQVTITVNPQDNLTVSSDATICSGQSIALSVTGNNSAVTWLPDNGTLDNVNSATPTASPLNTTTYTVTSIGACPDQAQVIITVNQSPVATVSGDTTIDQGESAILLAAGGTSYDWSPVLGLSDPTISNPTASPVLTTTYIVSVSNGSGCTDTASVTVTVNEYDCRPIFAPNAFTPNSDGINDSFAIINGNDYINFEIHIFNRIGELVYQSYNALDGWDGEYKGAKQPPGVYAVLVFAKCVNGKDSSFNGSVTLIR
jgi:gliding motility-associated-like protein